MRMNMIEEFNKPVNKLLNIYKSVRKIQTNPSSQHRLATTPKNINRSIQNKCPLSLKIQQIKFSKYHQQSQIQTTIKTIMMSTTVLQLMDSINNLNKINILNTKNQDQCLPSPKTNPIPI